MPNLNEEIERLKSDLLRNAEDLSPKVHEMVLILTAKASMDKSPHFAIQSTLAICCAYQEAGLDLRETLVEAMNTLDERATEALKRFSRGPGG